MSHFWGEILTVWGQLLLSQYNSLGIKDQPQTRRLLPPTPTHEGPLPLEAQGGAQDSEPLEGWGAGDWESGNEFPPPSLFVSGEWAA